MVGFTIRKREDLQIFKKAVNQQIHPIFILMKKEETGKVFRGGTQKMVEIIYQATICICFSIIKSVLLAVPAAKTIDCSIVR